MTSSFSSSLVSSNRSTLAVIERGPKERSIPGAGQPVRIVLVDDEQVVLRSLVRISAESADRFGWEVEAFSHASEALASLRKRPAHVVVSDARMAEMQGEELLKKVAELSPSAGRVLLSGALIDIRVPDTSSAHYYLRKPCSIAAFEQTLLNALEIQRELATSAELSLTRRAS